MYINVIYLCCLRLNDLLSSANKSIQIQAYFENEINVISVVSYGSYIVLCYKFIFKDKFVHVNK